MPQSQSVNLACPDCRSTRFEISVLKDEGVAAARCLKCDRNYLLLDSGDYWFDVIQQGYPRPGRCGCKGTAFMLRIDYEFRDDGDVHSVDVWSTCAACGKSRRQFGADIDYGPTGHLVDAPLTYCRNPRILYDLKELTLYAKRADIARVVRFLHDAGDCQFIACLRENDLWDVRNIDVDVAEQAILKETEFSLTYLWIYAAPRSIKVPASAVSGTRREDVFWKRREIIRISSPSRMLWGLFSTRPSLLYYIHFSNEYVEGERVRPKPERFRDLTARFVAWLQSEFVTWRGPNCFDNPQEHQRAFGRKYRDKAEKKGRRKS
jgi:hypothetical protein